MQRVTSKTIPADNSSGPFPSHRYTITFLVSRIQEIAQSFFNFIKETYDKINSYLEETMTLEVKHKITPIEIFSADSKEAKAIDTLISKRAKASFPLFLRCNSKYIKAKALVYSLDPLNVLAYIKSSPSLVATIHNTKKDWTPFTNRISKKLREQKQEDLFLRAKKLAEILILDENARARCLQPIQACLTSCDGEGLFALI